MVSQWNFNLFGMFGISLTKGTCAVTFPPFFLVLRTRYRFFISCTMRNKPKGLIFLGTMDGRTVVPFKESKNISFGHPLCLRKYRPCPKLLFIEGIKGLLIPRKELVHIDRDERQGKLNSLTQLSSFFAEKKKTLV